MPPFLHTAASIYLAAIALAAYGCATCQRSFLGISRPIVFGCTGMYLAITNVMFPDGSYDRLLPVFALWALLGLIGTQLFRRITERRQISRAATARH